MKLCLSSRSNRIFLFLCSLPCWIVPQAFTQTTPPPLYRQLRSLSAGGGAVHVDKLALKKERLDITLTGDVYPAAPVDGKVYGATFVGDGALRVEPGSKFEKANIFRFLSEEQISSSFTMMVMRFTDDTWSVIKASATGNSSAGRFVADLDDRILRESGLNLSARMAVGILNNDSPGMFFAEFEGGRLGRFAALIDHQGRAISETFGINAGEKGVVYKYQSQLSGTDIWTAFYDEADIQRGQVSYSDAFNLVSIPDYRMEVDLRDAGRTLGMKIEVDLVALRDGVSAVPMAWNEALDEYDNERLKKSVHVSQATMADGSPVSFVQESWDKAVTIFLPKPLAKGEKVTVRLLAAAADHPFYTWMDFYHVPLSTTDWYPRHGYLARSRFDITFLHKKDMLVAATGDRVSETADGGDMRTRWVTSVPASFVSFAVGRFKRTQNTVDVGTAKVPIEYYGLAPGVSPSFRLSSGSSVSLNRPKEDFIVAEMGNTVRYYSALYGDYPFTRLGGVFFLAGYGQGFPTMLLLPSTGRDDKNEFKFIAHEASHQWWGNMVAWRSYRDQWLSEGFADYSGLLYAGKREVSGNVQDILKSMRESLDNPPRTETGVGKGKLYEIGPLILGHRVATRQTQNAYTALTYNKGALVLRMLHFLFMNPSTGDDKAFYDMMREFVLQHRSEPATTESFFRIASAKFSGTPIAQKYRLTDLNWFLDQWVYQAAMPRYRVVYSFENRATGGALLKATVYQEGVEDKWFMPIPVKFDFGDKKEGRALIYASGPKTEVQLGLPLVPKRMLIDPDHWILTDKITDEHP